MRPLLGVAAGALAAAGGAVILGEYELDGATPFVAGTLFGLVLAEVVMAAGGRRDIAAAVASAVLAAGGLAWAAWISAGEDWSFVPGVAWVGVAVAAGAALAWVRASARRGARSRPGP